MDKYELRTILTMILNNAVNFNSKHESKNIHYDYNRTSLTIWLFNDGAMLKNKAAFLDSVDTEKNLNEILEWVQELAD